MTNERLKMRDLEEKDQKNLVKWLSTPEVLQYYEGRDQPFNREKVVQKFFKSDDLVTRCIVEYDGLPIGYLQFYEVRGEEKEIYGYGNSAEVIYGMDQFIGEPSYWNRGIGSKLVCFAITYIVREKEARRIVLDPQSQNKRAIRCYEKCGFQKKKLLPKHELHEGELRDCWLMDYAVRKNKHTVDE